MFYHHGSQPWICFLYANMFCSFLLTLPAYCTKQQCHLCQSRWVLLCVALNLEVSDFTGKSQYCGTQIGICTFVFTQWICLCSSYECSVNRNFTLIFHVKSHSKQKGCRKCDHRLWFLVYYCYWQVIHQFSSHHKHYMS